MPDLVIYGAGGLAREVAALASRPESQVRWPDGSARPVTLIGHLDDRPEVHGTRVNGLPVVGGKDWLAGHPEAAAIVAIGSPSVRQRIMTELGDSGVQLPSVLAGSTWLGAFVAIGSGVMMLPGVVVTENVTIGDGVLLNPHVSISHDCVIGAYCSLGPGVHLPGNVRVGEGTDIGTAASAIPGVRIGANAIIGAAACVTRDVPDGVTAVGVPARVLGRGADW